jgi:predicted transcriptional regulator
MVKATSFRISQHTQDMLKRIADKHDMSRRAVIEMLIRKCHEKEFPEWLLKEPATSPSRPVQE